MLMRDLKEGTLIQHGRTVLQVSGVYTHMVTAQVLLPVPKRTTVRSFTEDEILRGDFKYVTDHMYEKVEAAYPPLVTKAQREEPQNG